MNELVPNKAPNSENIKFFLGYFIVKNYYKGSPRQRQQTIPVRILQLIIHNSFTTSKCLGCKLVEDIHYLYSPNTLKFSLIYPVGLLLLFPVIMCLHTKTFLLLLFPLNSVRLSNLKGLIIHKI